MTLAKEDYVLRCRTLIESIGRKQVMEDCRISLQNLNYWLMNGVPRSWLMFLGEKYKSEYRKSFVNEAE